MDGMSREAEMQLARGKRTHLQDLHFLEPIHQTETEEVEGPKCNHLGQTPN
jgi:hypothetical protein